jgi:hypothetical protein
VKKPEAPDSATPSPAALTIRELVDFLCPGCWDRGSPPPWPPDTFALAGALLHRSGGYCRVLDGWPPGPATKRWEDEIRAIGKGWRASCVRSSDIPPRVMKWWKKILANHDRPVPDLAEDKVLCDALLQLLAAADEASTGFRFESPPGGRAPPRLQAPLVSASPGYERRTERRHPVPRDPLVQGSSPPEGAYPSEWPDHPVTVPEPGPLWRR